MAISSNRFPARLAAIALAGIPARPCSLKKFIGSYTDEPRTPDEITYPEFFDVIFR